MEGEKFQGKLCGRGVTKKGMNNVSGLIILSKKRKEKGSGGVPRIIEELKKKRMVKKKDRLRYQTALGRPSNPIRKRPTAKGSVIKTDGGAQKNNQRVATGANKVL